MATSDEIDYPATLAMARWMLGLRTSPWAEGEIENWEIVLVYRDGSILAANYRNHPNPGPRQHVRFVGALLYDAVADKWRSDWEPEGERR